MDTVSFRPYVNHNTATEVDSFSQEKSFPSAIFIVFGKALFILFTHIAKSGIEQIKTSCVDEAASIEEDTVTSNHI